MIFSQIQTPFFSVMNSDKEAREVPTFCFIFIYDPQNIKKKLLKSWISQDSKTGECRSESENINGSGIINGSNGIHNIKHVKTWIHEAVQQ
jgi:hypothetical protein